MKKNLLKLTLLLAIIAFSFQLSAQITYTFTNAGATGKDGPTQAQLNTAYASTNLNGAVTSVSGIQTWTVPFSGPYRIEAFGAQGGNAGSYTGGKGTKISGEMTLIAGSILKILIGQSGINAINTSDQAGGTGGGGSFVSTNINTPLIVAGGGGGASNYPSYATANGGDASTGNSGVSGLGTTYFGVGGTSGNGGTTPNWSGWHTGTGAGGFTGNGINNTTGNTAAYGTVNQPGISFINGGNGGQGGSMGRNGGFGGGGSAGFSGSGGGGYSGGGLSSWQGNPPFAGGGGGSFNSGTNQVNTASVNTGMGTVLITLLYGVNISQTSSISCNSYSTAALSSTVNGGVAPYTYTWTPGGANTTSLSGLGAGVYTLTVKDANNLVTSSIYTVTQPAVLAATPTQTNLTCFGSGNGRASVAVTGGTAPYSYLWSPTGGTTANAINLAANNYTCTVTDANACPVLTTTFNITQPVSLISATSTQTNVSCFGGSNGAGAITAAGGTGALTYSWTPSGGTSATASGLAANNYSCTIKDGNNCSITNTLNITQPTVLASTLVSQTNVSCNAGSNGAASVSATGGTTAYSYAWTPTGGSSASATGLAAGTYTCTITDAKSCVSTTTIAITQPAVLAATTTQTNVICNGFNTGAANVATTGGTTAYMYAWAPTGGTAATASSLVAGNYTCTITDANSCTLVKTFALTEGAAFTISGSATNAVLCNGFSTTLNGAGATTYTWTGGVTNATSFVPTTTISYSLTGKNASNCPASNTVVVTVTVNPNPTVVVNSGSICTTKSFTMTPTGASTYVYTGGSAIVSPLTNSSYTVTGTSALGCTNTAVATVTVNANPTVAVTSGSICNGSSFTMIPSGASTYLYSSGSAAVSPTTNTSYTVTGTSAVGCTNTAVSNVTVNAIPSVAVNSGSICSGKSFTLTPTGASTYVYTGGSAIVSPTSNSSYTVTGASAGCSNTAVASVTVNVNPTVIVNSGSICNGDTFTMTPSGASTYVYTGGSATVSPASNTNYTVTGTSALGCTNTAVSNLTVIATPVLTVNSGSLCSGNNFTFAPTGATSYTYSSGSAIVTPSATTSYTISGSNSFGCVGNSIKTITVSITPVINVSSGAVCTGGSWTITPTGAATYTYSSGSAVVTPTSATTDYTVSGSNIDGCQSLAVITITVNPTLLFNPNSGSVCIGSSYTITPTGASSYTFSSGTAIVTPTTNTTYTIVAENSVGCLGTDICSIVVNALPTVTAATDFTLLCVGEMATLTAGGASTYVWNTSATTASTSVTPTTTTSYNVNGTDVNGCVNTANVTVNVNDCVGIQQLSSAQLNVNAYPNPTSGLVTLELNAATQVTITNALGQVVFTETVLEGKQTLDLKNQTNGLYFMNFNQNGKQQTIKVIKN